MSDSEDRGDTPIATLTEIRPAGSIVGDAGTLIWENRSLQADKGRVEPGEAGRSGGPVGQHRPELGA